MKTIAAARALRGHPLGGTAHSSTRNEPQELHGSQSPLELHRILVPLDVSPCSKKALAYALVLANEFKANVVVLYVVELFPADYCLGVRSAVEANRWEFEQAQAWLTELRHRCVSPSATDIDVMVSYGKPFREIARVAKERNVDLIIISTHGYTGLKHLQLGSTAERVVRHAPCPVLVVREEEHDFVAVDRIKTGTRA